ncbi:B12-binding domain-containing radical SAM protein [Verrucomicrobiota bacterium]
MAKIALLYFDVSTGYYPSFHHGIAFLIGALHHHHEIVFHHLARPEQIQHVSTSLADEHADIVGLSFTTNQVRHLKEFLKIWKRRDEKLVIAGGVHPTLEREKILEQFPEIDGVCVGEGEHPFVSLCRKIEQKEDYLPTPSFIFRKGEQIVKNPVMEPPNIEGLSFPDYSMFDYKKIIRDNGNCFPMMLSRGCPYNCSYCCNHAFRKIYQDSGKYVRMPSPAHGIALIQNNLKLYPETKKMVFADDTFTWNKKWLKEFCELYRRSIHLPFECNARVETVDDEIAATLKSAGCVSVSLGIESGNEWLRMNILNRKHSNHVIQQAFSIMKSHNIKTSTSNMIGLPFETKTMAKDTLLLNKQLSPDYGGCCYFYPFPGTYLFDLCVKYRMIGENIENMSGYFEGPSLKPLFMTTKETIGICNKINMYFSARFIVSKMKLPLIVENFIINLFFIFRYPLMKIINRGEKSWALKKTRAFLRKIAIRYFR